MPSTTIASLLLLAAVLVPACTSDRAHTPPPVGPEPIPPPVEVAPALAPVELEVLGELANDYLRADAATEVMARIRIRSPESEDGQRPRAAIGLVVDTSASMEGEAIAQARGAAVTLLDGLRDGDVLSVVTFGSASQVVVPNTVLGPDTRPQIRTAIEAMAATGTTDLAGGLRASLAQLQRQARVGEINRMVLVSDGVPNDPSPLASLAQQARGAGISITTLGLGLEYHETLLGQLAQASGGTFHFVEDPAEVAAVFRDEVLSIDRLAARGVSLTLTPGPGVQIVAVSGHAGSTQGSNLVVGLPDMVEGETQQVIIRLAVGEHYDGATVELLDGVVGYADARTNTVIQRRTFLSARATDDDEQRAQGVDLDVAVAAARATTAAATLEIMAMARRGQVEAATAKLDATVEDARALSERVSDAALAKLIDDLVELRPTLPGLAPVPVAKAPRSAQPRARDAKGKQSAVVRATGAHGEIGLGGSSGAVMAGSTGAVPRPEPAPLSEGAARGVRASHERAYKTLHGSRPRRRGR
ncbi:MAG: VWA domain-containing protein [Myxococcota bacterium]